MCVYDKGMCQTRLPHPPHEPSCSGAGPSFSKHLKSVTMVTCLSPKFCSAKLTT